MIKKYTPITLTLVLILFLTVLFMEDANLYSFSQLGLGFFFLIFGYFKCMDLNGFAAYFKQYDIIANHVHAYAIIYPFIELALGLSYLMSFHVQTIAIITITIVVVRGIGIVRAAQSDKVLMCGCMGTAAMFPINWMTICANIATIGAAVILLLE